MPFPTGDTVTTEEVVTFCLTCPNVPWVVQVLQGMLSEAILETDWEQVGTATIEEAQEIFETIFLTMGECP